MPVSREIRIPRIRTNYYGDVYTNPRGNLRGCRRRIPDTMQIHGKTRGRIESFKNALTGCTGYLRLYMEQTSVHGLRHTMVKGRHPLEILLWITCILVSILCAAAMIHSSWIHYSANPTVVVLEIDYRSWEITSPAVTMCYMNRLNKTKATDYIKNTWMTDANTEKGRYYMRFLNAVANMAYSNLHQFQEYEEDQELSKVDMSQLALKLQENQGHKISSKSQEFPQVVAWTEFGICHVGQSAVAHNFAVKPEQYADYPLLVNHSTFSTMPYTIRMRMTHDDAFIFAIHSPYGVIDANTRMEKVKPDWSIVMQFKYISTVASDSLRSVTPFQRRCNFPDEVDRTGANVYTYHACLMDCHKHRVLYRCGCIPTFYSNFGKEQVCNAAGLACASKHMEDIINEKCKCNPLCEETVFLREELKHFSNKNLLKMSKTNQATAICSINKRTKFRYKRDIVFSFADLLVSFGGIAAFFLGCSLLSGVELVYYFTLRLMCHVVRKPRAQK